MQVEKLYEDLYAIAKKRIEGQLDADSVQGAIHVLALPRYVNDPDAAATLASDIHAVIETIPVGEQKGKLREAARLYFSLEAGGQSIVARRLQIQARSGPADEWMNRAVLLRVLLGLLALGPVSAQPSPAHRGFQVREESVRLHSWLRGLGAMLCLDYRIELLAPGPHCFVVPVPGFGTSIEVIGPDGFWLPSRPTLQQLEGPTQRVSALQQSGGRQPKASMLTFGLGQEAGDEVRISMVHRSFRLRERWLKYDVRYPIDVLRLEIGAPSGGKTFVSLRDSEQPPPEVHRDEAQNRSWCVAVGPEVGSSYLLHSSIPLHEEWTQRALVDTRYEVVDDEAEE